ncbi:hypothetical protein KM92DES2_12645 [uncultured Desulfovibrio sp.]|uniref:Uncharacterized protein n=2 Tax=Bacteria TaxID=2 RepID=A0A212KBX0_9BACT|nr:hypothetical protein KM92DES2_12645 [uncultured Desulfovibrio sp.]
MILCQGQGKRLFYERSVLALAVATKEATDASSVVTQETTLKDSTRNDTVSSLQSLSPSVGPSGNGCREDSSAYGT